MRGGILYRVIRGNVPFSCPQFEKSDGGLSLARVSSF
jgi:hypothetical protein